jgi:hypothetical protein
MTTKENARWQAGAEVASRRILARTRGACKAAVLTLALWRLLPYPAAEWIIRRMRLRGA